MTDTTNNGGQTVDEETTPQRWTVADGGCIVDGWHGHHASTRVLAIATDNGFPFPDGPAWEDPEPDMVDELVERAVDWMNDHLAPVGSSFGWHEGGLYLWSDDDWSEL